MNRVFVYEEITTRWAIDELKPSIAPSLLAEGQAMRDALLADFLQLDPQVPFMLLPQRRPPALPLDAWFFEHAAAAEWTLIIAPETDGRLEHLARLATEAGTRLLGPSPDAIRLTSDKLALFEHWRDHDVPTPKTWIANGEDRTATCLAKPRDGAGSDGVRLVSVDDPEPTMGVLLQEYIPGLAASVSLLVSPEGVEPLLPGEQILTRDGTFRYLGGRWPLDAELARRAIGLARRAIDCVPGLRGYVGVDVVLGDDGQDWAIEINPRLTTSYVGLRQAATINLAGAMLRAAEGRIVPAPSWKPGRFETRVNQ